MYLSDRDLRWAIDCGKLIVEPRPEKIDSSSIDLHLDSSSEAKIWDTQSFSKGASSLGYEGLELRLGKFDYRKVAENHLIAPPEDETKNVFRRGRQIIVKPGGFLLWQTKERVGTPEDGANLICFIDGKSTRARTGLLVHLTAPTIHSSWSGKVTLEIANLGPFHFLLEEGDAIAQITVALITNIPEQGMKKRGSVTYSQVEVGGNSIKTSSKT